MKFVKKSGLSLIAIVISIIAICLAYLRCEPFEKDWLGILVGILSLLVTILLGWNIFTFIDLKKEWISYKNESDKKLLLIDKIKEVIYDDRYRNKMALDANADMMQGEIYSALKLYLLAYREYIASLVRYSASGDTDLQKNIIRKIEYCIRCIRKELGREGYVLDWDFTDDIYHYKNVASIREEPENYIGLNIEEEERIIRFLSAKTDYMMINDFKFVLYRKDVEIKERGCSIYALFKKYGDIYKHDCRVYDDYEQFMECILKDLESDYDFIGIYDCRFGNIKESLMEIKNIKECERKRCMFSI